ncbi:cytidine deaminase [Segetibacter sp. 3557_3]|uniref:cytidine deaminase n=1 Tax=Segetibacter sp. 3557_3 TaxID=2547429 RepID=UPI0010585AB1|nr:cytidine deaminase [Segetibacter sp. 3557_3]TDH28809.1 cytidine deaminase [Segetibacter sp. 3557_3]
MKQEEYRFSFKVYDSISELDTADADILNAAMDATKTAYAPYSNFQVGAAALLQNGKMVRGTNQENASYPVGICAERVLLSTASSLYPNEPIATMAVTYNNQNGKSNHPICPCGMCRQSLAEHESRTGQPIRIILGGREGKVHVIERASMLLPFSFSSEDMNLDLRQA